MPAPNDDVRDELKAVLAASRELPPEHDDALVDHFLEHVRSRQAVEIRRPPTRRGSEMVRGRLVPIAIAVGTGTFLSLVGALMSGASIEEFLLLWVFTTLVMGAVVQIGLIIERAQRENGRPVK